MPQRAAASSLKNLSPDPLGGTNSVSSVPPHAADLIHAAVPPLPTKPTALGFCGGHIMGASVEVCISLSGVRKYELTLPSYSLSRLVPAHLGAPLSPNTRLPRRMRLKSWFFYRRKMSDERAGEVNQVWDCAPVKRTNRPRCWSRQDT